MSENPAPSSTATQTTPEPETPPDWEAQLEAAGQEAPGRRNGFDRARKKTFLKALARGTTLADAAKAAGVSPRTVYNHQDSDLNFAAACRAAVEVSAPKIELAAFERGVTGVEEDVISYGKHVGTRVKRSDALLQTLLKGSNPDKYGPRAGFQRGKVGKKLGKKWIQKERARLKEELRPELMAEFEAGDFGQEMREETTQRILRRIGRLRQQMIKEEGYTLHRETKTLTPPGWTMVRTETLCVSCASREVRELHESAATA